MTFQQHVDILASLIAKYNLCAVAVNNSEDKINGIIESRNISIFINYDTKTIMWADSRTGDYKNFNY
jgi:hypothetical protein